MLVLCLGNLFYHGPIKLSDYTWLENKYHEDPEACDLSKFMMVANVVSGHSNIVTLFWKNKLGVDVDIGSSLCLISGCFELISNVNKDDHCIVVFEGSECLKSGLPVKSHLTLINGPCCPSDHFLCLHFQRCLALSVHLVVMLQKITETKR